MINNNINKVNKSKKPVADIIFEIVKITAIGALIIFTLYPLLSVVLKAFSSSADIGNFFPKKIDLFAIKYVLTNASFYQSYGVTIVVVLFGTILSVVVMAMLAYPLSKKDLPFRKTIFIIFIIAMLFSGGLIPNYVLMSSLGLTDSIFALIFPGVVNVFHMILMKDYFESLPESLEESAKIDGASNIQIFFKIILPLSVPMIVTVSLFTAVIYWNNYFNALLYISSQAKHLYPLPFFIIQLNEMFADPMASQLLGDAFFYLENIRAATILVSIIPILVGYPFFLKYFTKGVTLGSDK